MLKVVTERVEAGLCTDVHSRSFPKFLIIVNMCFHQFGYFWFILIPLMLKLLIFGDV